MSRFNTADADDHNLTYGIDGRLGIGDALSFDGWAGLTTTPVPAGEQAPGSGFNGGEYGFAGGMRYVTRDWQVSSGYRQVGDAFNPEVGFVNRRAYRHMNFRVLRHMRTGGVPWFREFRPHISGNMYWTLGGFNESYLSFTPRLYVQANVQYNDDTRDVGTNVRVGWLDTAGTGLFLVWNDTNHRGPLERTGIVAGPRQRQLVVKYSRLFSLTR